MKKSLITVSFLLVGCVSQDSKFVMLNLYSADFVIAGQDDTEIIAGNINNNVVQKKRCKRFGNCILYYITAL